MKTQIGKVVNTLRKGFNCVKHWCRDHDGLATMLYFVIAIVIIMTMIKLHTPPVIVETPTPPVKVATDYSDINDPDVYLATRIDKNELLLSFLLNNFEGEFVYSSMVSPNHFIYIFTKENVSLEYTNLKDEENLEWFRLVGETINNYWKAANYDATITVMLCDDTNYELILYIIEDGVPVFSCYEPQRKPTPEELQEADAYPTSW